MVLVKNSIFFIGGRIRMRVVTHIIDNWLDCWLLIKKKIKIEKNMLLNIVIKKQLSGFGDGIQQTKNKNGFVLFGEIIYWTEP